MNQRHRAIGSPRWVGAVTGLLLLTGCREQHLLGEDRDATFPPVNGGGTGGTGMAGAGGAGGAVAPTGTGGASDPGPPTPDGPPVVPLGGTSNGGWPIAISPEEVARRLSSFVLQKPPSAALTAAVVASAPRTNEDVGQLTEGLLLGDASLAGRKAFYAWWLTLDDFAKAMRDATLFPTFTPAVAAALVDETLLFAEDITWRPEGDLTLLMTEPAAFVTSETAPWFPGATAVPGAPPARVALDATYYAGLLTQPAVVASHDYAERAEPSGRGMKVLDRFFCEPIPVPADPALTPHGVVPAGQPLRQWVMTAVGNSGCGAACHALTDPPGFAFGHFDAIGAFHDTEAGLPVDTSGIIAATGDLFDGPDLVFTGAADLARQLAALAPVRTCFAAKWIAFSTGKADTTPADGVTLGLDPRLDADADYVVKRATIQGRLDLRGTIRAVTETHSFLDP